MSTYRPRLSVEITPEQQAELHKWLDHGMQKRIFSIIVDDVIDMLNKHGRNFLAAAMLKQVSYADYTSMEINSGNDSRPTE